MSFHNNSNTFNNNNNNNNIDLNNIPLPLLSPPRTPNTPNAMSTTSTTSVTPIILNNSNTHIPNNNLYFNNIETNTNLDNMNKEMSPNVSRYLEDCYDKLVELVVGTEYDLTNWSLLMVKGLKCVSYINDITAEEQVELAIEIVISYLDNNTDITDEVLVFIKKQASKLAWNILENQGINSKEHKKNEKAGIKVQKRMDKNSKKMDIDVLSTPLQIINTIINKVETIIKVRKYDVESFMTALPSIIMNIVSLVDKYKHLSKVEKKNLIIQAIQTIIKTKVPVWFKLNNKQVESLNLLSASLPQLVETCIGVVNGDMDFKVDFNNSATVLIKLLNILSSLFILCKK